jgi:hypothetical protein
LFYKTAFPPKILIIFFCVINNIMSDPIEMPEGLYSLINVVDKRFENSNSIPIPLYRGSAKNSKVKQQASSATTTGVNFQVVPPNLMSTLDRRVYLEVPAILKITLTNGTGADIDTLAGLGLVWGTSAAFAPFPLHQMMNLLTLSTNGTPSSYKVPDALPALIRHIDYKTLGELDCPSKPDYYASYSSAAGTSDNVLSNQYDPSARVKPRGVYRFDGLFTDAACVTAADNTNCDIANAASKDFYIKVTFYEPLLISPLLLGSKDESEGIHGINKLEVNIQFLSTSTPIRLTPVNNLTVTACTITSISAQSYLHCNFLSVPTSANVSLSPRNCVPFQRLFNHTNPFAAGQITSNSYQLSGIPHAVYMYCKKKQSALNCTNADRFIPITGVSIDFGGSQNLLSNSSQRDLWVMSLESGSNMSWEEFSGVHQGGSTVASQKTTVGSVVCLQFGRHIPIEDPWLCAGSSGLYQFSATIQTSTTLPAGVVANDFELQLMFVYDGFMANERSLSQLYTGFLTKAQILSVAEQPVEHVSAYRMFGGSIFSRAGRKIQKFWRKVQRAKPSKMLGTVAGVTGMIPHPYAKAAAVGLGAASKGLNMVGAGTSAGGAYYTAAGMDSVPTKLRHRVSK